MNYAAVADVTVTDACETEVKGTVRSTGGSAWTDTGNDLGLDKVLSYTVPTSDNCSSTFGTRYEFEYIYGGRRIHMPADSFLTVKPAPLSGDGCEFYNSDADWDTSEVAADWIDPGVTPSAMADGATQTGSTFCPEPGPSTCVRSSTTAWFPSTNLSNDLDYYTWGC